MLRIRLQRRGKKNYATYRVVVAEASAPIKGRFIADLGPYNPHTDAFTVDKDKATEWITKGAKPTPTVHNLFVDNGIIKGEKMTSWRPKGGNKPEEAAAEVPATPEPAEEAPAESTEEEKEQK